MQHLLSYFIDPVLRGPTLGCMLMCFVSALVGVIAYLRRQSLLGEALSHAIYPGVIIGVLLSSTLTVREDSWLATTLIFGASFCSGLFALFCIQLLEKRYRCKSDSALCFVLSTFFGVGLTLLSYVQQLSPHLIWRVQLYLFGQAATMTDFHIVIYGVFSLLVVLTLILFYKEILIVIFDRSFANTLALPVHLIDRLLSYLIVLATVIGVRSVGVVLMSAMLIAPAVAARKMTDRLHRMFAIAGLIGALSGFAGNFLSVEGACFLNAYYCQSKLSLPTGPMIVLFASSLAFLTLIFKRKGQRSQQDLATRQLLTALWRQNHRPLSWSELKQLQLASSIYLAFILFSLYRSKIIARGQINGKISGQIGYYLTAKGKELAQEVALSHKLYRAYLALTLNKNRPFLYKNERELAQKMTPSFKEQLLSILAKELHA